MDKEQTMTKQQVILEFKDNVDNILDPDFGDFKRRCGNYIHNLVPYFADNEEAFAILRDMKHYVAFGDNLRSKEEVKFYIEQKVAQLQKIVG